MSIPVDQVCRLEQLISNHKPDTLIWFQNKVHPLRNYSEQHLSEYVYSLHKYAELNIAGYSQPKPDESIPLSIKIKAALVGLLSIAVFLGLLWLIIL